MFKFSPKRCLLSLLVVVVPVTVFLAARSAASWRPQLVGKWKDTVKPNFRDSHFLHLSPDEKWLACEGEGYNSAVLLDLTGEHPPHHIQGATPVFSNDSRLLVTYQYPELFLYEGFRLRWHKPVALGSAPPQGRNLRFVNNDSQLQYNTYNWGRPFKRQAQVNLDTRTGKQLSEKDVGVSNWQQTSSGSTFETIKQKVSFVDSRSNRLLYSFQTSNAVDVWRLSPDGKKLWVALSKQGRFNILDAKTGHKLWSLSNAKSPTGLIFQNYPSWEENGKTLVIIENDALVVRDAYTGKVLLQHKNTIRSPLRSWAFTHDGKAVYLLNEQGEIFRQRLR